MKWFDGSVEDAVNEAKKRNSLFVVYVEGLDKSSEIMTIALNCKDISKKLQSDSYVSIRVKAESQDYSHFVNIYKYVPVPSFFLIGLNGVPIAVVYNFGDNVESLRKEILRVLSLKDENKLREKIKLGNNPVDLLYNESVSETSEGDDFDKDDKVSVDISLPDELQLQSSSCLLQETSLSKETEAETISETKSENKEINKSLSKNMSRPGSPDNNIPNTEMNKSKSQSRRQQENNENIRLQEIQQEKIRNEIDRQRILNDIAIDKQERVIRQQSMGTSMPLSVSSTLPGTSDIESPIVTAYQSRIQFRKPDGSTCTAVFNAGSVIDDLRLYVSRYVNINSRRFKLATAFPRHIFTEEENNQSLEELGLVPNAVIIIIPMSDDRTPASYVFSQISGTFWYVATPIISLFQSIQNSIFGTPQITGGVLRRTSAESSRQNDLPRNRRPISSQMNSAGRENLHTLANINNNNKKDDDKNNVWNGNSTQQSQ